MWACAALLFLVFSTRAVAVEIPRAPTRWVTDSTNFISDATERALDKKLEAYEKQTGHQVIVWIGDSIGSTPLEEFMVKTFEAWKPGRKGKDDGLLLVVLARDRKLGIEVGYGLEDRVPDAIASRIISEVMTPKLREGDANGALSAGVDAILAAIEGKPFTATGGEPAKATKKPPSVIQLIGFGAIALLFLILLATNPTLAMHLLFVLASGRGGGGGFGGGSGGGFGDGGGRSGGGGARGSW